MILIATKGNREEVITEDMKDLFLEDGFSIYEKEEGKEAKLVSSPNDSNVSEKELKALKSENKKLKDLLKTIKANYEIEELKGVEL